MIEGVDQLIRSHRRSLSIEISTNARVVVRAPQFVSDAYIADFIGKKDSWIKRQQERMRKRLEARYTFIWPLGGCANQWRAIYRRLAGKILVARCAVLAKHFALSLNNIKISSAKTRWGSCSSKQVISLNWRLIFAPLPVIDYLIIHELAHLTIKDHSSRYWRRVKEMCPFYLEAERWLKENGHILDM